MSKALRERSVDLAPDLRDRMEGTEAAAQPAQALDRTREDSPEGGNRGGT